MPTSFRRTAATTPAVFFFAFLLPLWSSPAHADDDLADGSFAPVTLVVYNLKNYLAMERRVGGEVVADAPKPEAEIAAVIEGLVAIRPDILGVCEIGDETHIADLQTRLKEAGIDLPHTEMVRDSAGWNRNLALLSRYPIVSKSSRADYTYELDGTKHAFQRGVLDATVAISPSYRLRYVGLHLKSKREVPEGDQSLMRLNEARLARQHIDRILEADPNTNLVVAGDFNDLRHEAPVKTLQGAFGTPGYLASLTLADPMGFTWTHFWSFADSYSRFDYVLLGGGLKGEIDRKASGIHHWENWEKASDHRPLVVKILPEDR